MAAQASQQRWAGQTHAASLDENRRVIEFHQRIAASAQPFEVEELTLADMARGMAEGRFSARMLAERYLARIESLDRAGPALRSVIEINPDALAIAVNNWLVANRAGRTPGIDGMTWLTWEQSAEQLKAVVFGGNWMPDAE